MASKKKPSTKVETKQDALAAKTKKMQEKLLLQLEKYPIIQAACERAGVGRATYYKWRTEDKEFMKRADQMLNEGIKFINDLAESKLIRNIQDGQNTAIIFWLKNRNKAYSEKALHKHMHEIINHEIDPEQIDLIRKVMWRWAEKLKKNEERGINKDTFDANMNKDKKNSN